MEWVDVNGFSKRFGSKTVVDNISLRVREREIVGFLGPNGSGKTTTIRMLCGLLRPDTASGTCLGFDLRTQAGSIKLQTGYMTQRFSFYEDLTIEENLDFVARLYDLRPRLQKVDEALHSIGLQHRRRQLAGFGHAHFVLAHVPSDWRQESAACDAENSEHQNHGGLALNARGVGACHGLSSEKGFSVRN